MNPTSKPTKRSSLTSTLAPFKLARAVPAAPPTVKPTNLNRISFDNSPRSSSNKINTPPPRTPLINKPLAALSDNIAAPSTPRKRSAASHINTIVSSPCARGHTEEKDWEEVLAPAKKPVTVGSGGQSEMDKENGTGGRGEQGRRSGFAGFSGAFKAGPGPARDNKSKTQAPLLSSASAINKAARNPRNPTTTTKGVKAVSPQPKVVPPVRKPSPLRQVSDTTTTTPPSIRTRASVTSPRGSSTVIGVSGHVKAKAQTIEATKVKETSLSTTTTIIAPAAAKHAPEALVLELRVQLSSAGKANEDLSQALSTLTASKASVDEDNENLRADLEDAECRAATMAQMLLDKRVRVKAMEEESEALDKSFRAAHAEFRTGVADLERQIEDLRADATVSEERIEELEEEADKHASRVTELEEGQEEWIAYSSQVGARIFAREQEVEQLKATVADKENELGFLRIQQRLAEVDIKELHEQGADLVAQLEAAQEVCESSEIARREEILAFASTASAYTQRAREAEEAKQISELGSLELEIRLEQSTLAQEELVAAQSELSSKLATTSTELATSAAQIQESKGVISTLNETVRAAHTEIEALKSRLVELAPAGTVIAVEEYSTVVAEKEELVARLEQYLDERDDMLALKDMQMDDLSDRKFRVWEKLKEAEVELEDARTAHQRTEELLAVAQSDAARSREQADFLTRTSRTLREGLIATQQELAEAKAQANTLKADIDILSASNLDLGDKLESAQLSIDIAQEEKAEAEFAQAQTEALAEDLARALEEKMEDAESAESALQTLAGTAAKFISEAERFQFSVTEFADTEICTDFHLDPISPIPSPAADDGHHLLSIDPYREELEHLLLFNGRLRDQLECEKATSSCAQRSVVRLLEQVRELRADCEMYEGLADDFSERWSREWQMRMELEKEVDEDRFVYLVS